MKRQLTLKETRELKTLFLESKGMLTEGILDKIKDSIKKRFSGRDTGDLVQSLSDNLGIDENSSVEEIEEKLKQETGGKKDLKILTKVLYHVSGLAAGFLVWEVQALIGAGIIKYFDYNPIAVAAVVISVIFSVTDKWEKIRRKGLGKEVDQFLHGKRSHLGDFDRKKEDDKEMNENRKVIRLSESDLTRIVKKVIQENNKQNLNEGIGTALLVLTGGGLFYLGRKLKKFIDKYGKYISSVQLGTFLGKIKSIEDGKEEGKVLVKERGGYTYLAIVVDGQVFDSLTIDVENDTIYSGHRKEPKQSDMILPRVLPYDSDTEDIEEIRHAEEVLVDEILEIIAKYGKSKNETDDEMGDERL